MRWEFGSRLSSTKRLGGARQENENVAVVELSCIGEGGKPWNRAEQWTVQATGGRRSLVMTPLKVWNVRDNAGKAVRNSAAYSKKTQVEFLGCS